MNHEWPERLWNREQLTQEFPNCHSLREILKQVTTTIEDSGEVVCEVCVNGIILNEDEENKFAESTLDEVVSLRIKSENPLKLLDESIDGCKSYIDKIMVAIERASQLFRTNDLNAANDQHAACIQATKVFVEMITHYKNAYQSLKGDLPVSWTQLENAMLTSLTQILESYSQKNFILVADLLEYDLSNIFSAWRNELANLERHQIEEPT